MQLSFSLVALCLLPVLVVPLPVQKITGADLLRAFLGEPATADVESETHVSAPATETVLDKEGGMSETGCDSLADKDKVLEAIALFTNNTDIECIQNKVQVTDVGYDITTVTISGEKKTCKIARGDTAVKGTKGRKTRKFTHVDLKTGKTMESPSEQATIATENKFSVRWCKGAGNPGKGRRGRKGKKFGSQLLETSTQRYSGHIRLSAEDWAKIPVAPEPTIEELQANPSSFNEISAHPGCASYEIQDQGTCGSCWAFTAARVYGDRLCRAAKSRWNAAMSEQDIVSCYTSGGFYMNGNQVDGVAGTWSARDGCSGGNHLTQWIAQAESGGGRVARWADPYTGKGKDVDACGTVDSKAVRFGVTKGSIYKIAVGAVDTMKTQIYAGGSIGAGIDIYADFSSYSGGVYIKSSNDYAGAHAVALIGWGTDGGVDYWHLANSWGKGWGESGYGRIRSGTNEAKIENECSYMAPAVPTSCSSATACANGEFDADCACRCHGSWSGSTCATCGLSCQNGGTLDSSTCTCSCTTGYFGTMCQDYVIGRWKSKMDANYAQIEFKWKLSDYHSGSFFTRFTQPIGTAGNAEIGGTKVDISSAEGTSTAVVGWFMMVPGYDKAFYYALSRSLGTNEFGASRGSEMSAVPALYFTEANGCLSGGHKPVEPAVQSALCANAYTPAPQQAAPPSHSHTPHSHTPHSHHSHNPHRHTPHSHTPHNHHRHNPHSHVTVKPTEAPTEPPRYSAELIADRSKCGNFQWTGVHETESHCMARIQSDASCNQRFFLWVLHADKNCACITSKDTDCTDPANLNRDGRAASVYQIVDSQATESPTAQPTTQPTTLPTPCQDDNAGIKAQGHFENCAAVKDQCNHENAQYRQYARQYCPVTCDACGTSSPTSPSECTDDDAGLLKVTGQASCANLMGVCHDPQMGPTMKSYCPKTCGVCGEGGGCSDNDVGIKADSGGFVSTCGEAEQYCTDAQFKDAVVKNCPRTCGVCGCSDNDAGIKAESGGTVSTCKDAQQYCTDTQFKEPVLRNCPKTCGVCGSLLLTY